MYFHSRVMKDGTLANKLLNTEHGAVWCTIIAMVEVAIETVLIISLLICLKQGGVV